MLPHKSMRRADVVVSIVFMALGAAVIYKGYEMPWASARTGGSVQWYLSPGLFPVVIGTLLMLFSARVLLQAVREGGHVGVLAAVRAWSARLPGNSAIHRVVTIMLLLVAYVFLGVGKIDYYVASSLFLFVAFVLFWFPASDRPLAAKLAIAALVAALIPLAIGSIFTRFLHVPMP